MFARKLGSCYKCIRYSLVAATVSAALLFVGASLNLGAVVLYPGGALAVFFASLTCAHAVAFVVRRQRASEERASPAP